MSEYSNEIEKLKIKLKLVNKEKIKQKRLELALRSAERSLTEELSVITAESELMLQQLEELKNQILAMKSQIEMVEICKASEKSKIENHAACLGKHIGTFKDFFKKERESYEMHHEKLLAKEIEEQEMERQQRAEAKEMNDQMGKEAAGINDECEAVERECGVLTKRNRAIMLKLRRKLVETEGARRELLKQTELESCGSNYK